MQQQMADDVINVVARGGAVPKSHILAGNNEHQVHVRVILRGDSVLFCK